MKDDNDGRIEEVLGEAMVCVTGEEEEDGDRGKKKRERKNKRLSGNLNSDKIGGRVYE